jgi:hypothetical protein
LGCQFPGCLNPLGRRLGRFTRASLSHEQRAQRCGRSSHLTAGPWRRLQPMHCGDSSPPPPAAQESRMIDATFLRVPRTISTRSIGFPVRCQNCRSSACVVRHSRSRPNCWPLAAEREAFFLCDNVAVPRAPALQCSQNLSNEVGHKGKAWHGIVARPIDVDHVLAAEPALQYRSFPPSLGTRVPTVSLDYDTDREIRAGVDRETSATRVDRAICGETSAYVNPARRAVRCAGQHWRQSVA